MFKIVLSFLSIINGQPLYMDNQVQEDYTPILGYHSIDTFTDSTTITIEDFRDQVEYLTDTAKCNWITMETFSNYIENQEKLPTNTCIMNFDDGKSTQYHSGLCTLNTHNVAATYYIATQNIGSNSYHLTSDEISNLYNIGHTIGAHTLTHAHLSELTYEEQEDEILQSKVELENMGYSITSFAYPYGEYNDDTLDIIRKSDYILTRDTSQDIWKDIRTPVISFNDDYLLHFHYIKPEGFSGTELWQKIKYTGWWQFEDNYKLINDDDGDIIVASKLSLLPTDTSFGILALYDIGDEISTQFITKYDGSFTLDMIVYNSTSIIGFDVIIDGITYSPQSHHYTSEYSLKYTIGIYDYYNFYVNILSLIPGIHTLNILNTGGKKMYLDKFRLFSNVNQDFQDVAYYKDCDPEIDDYCSCSEIITPSPTSYEPDPTCEFGILSGDICCLSSCGTCGGSGCGNREGGGSGCCSGTIASDNNSCDNQGAPCVVKIEPELEPDPTCEFGILSKDVCCSLTCGTCGGSGCGDREGGGSSCCSGTIISDNNSCDNQGAPCVIQSEIELEPDPTCENGILSDNVCCDLTCGTCGGSGCGDREGGSHSCCSGTITSDNNSCDNQGAPCIIN